MDQVSKIINAIGKANSIGILSILAALLFLMVFMLLKKKREREGRQEAKVNSEPKRREREEAQQKGR